MRTLTNEQVKKYQPVYTSKYALLDKKKDSIFLESNTLESCQDALKTMTPAHPKYKDMELVQIPHPLKPVK